MDNYRIVKHKVPAAHLREHPRATAHSEEDVLYLAVNQYIPLDNPTPQPGDVTIIAAHAVGFNKELYEPLWEELTAQAKQQGWRIRSIWMADTAWHGESYVLNEDLLGNSPGWYDHPRDLANLINLKRAEMPRPIIGVGHSMGGNQVTKLALDHPSLFTTLVLIDPVIQMKSAELIPGTPSAAQASTFRRDIWPSRTAAKSSFLTSPYYQIWDARVLDKWVEFGLRDCPNPQHPTAPRGAVSLATPPAQEVWSFLRPNYAGAAHREALDRFALPDLDATVPGQTPFYRSEPIATYRRLPELRPSCLYLFGAVSFVCDAATAKDKVARTGIGAGGSGGERAGRVKGVTFEGVGHLIAMEVPGKTAAALAEWVRRELEVFREQRRGLEDWWASDLRSKQRVDEAWVRNMGRPPVRGGKGGESKM